MSDKIRCPFFGCMVNVPYGKVTCPNCEIPFETVELTNGKYAYVDNMQLSPKKGRSEANGNCM